MTPVLQLKKNPYSSASGIYDNSIFETGRIILNGVNNGIGLFIGSTQTLTHENNLTLGVSYNSASLMVAGDVLIDKYLYVESGITTNGDIQIGMTGSTEQNLTLGLDNPWRMKKINDTIRWEKFNSLSQEWDLMIRFSEC